MDDSTNVPDDLLFFVELPDEKVCFKVPKVRPTKRYRPVEASGHVTNMIYDRAEPRPSEPEERD